MKENHAEPGGWLRSYLRRTIIVALVIVVGLIAVVVLLDYFGSQPQPFQYFLH
jgi:hypothetical protein